MKKFLFLLILFYSNYALAYLDPVSFSALVSGLIGAIAASIIYLKNFWIKVIYLIKKLFKVK